MKSNQNKKISFTKQLWYSIFKFEKYPDMTLEGVWSAIKYVTILLLALTVILSVKLLEKRALFVEQICDYVEKNIPEFSFEDGKIEANIEEPIIIENIGDGEIDRIVINLNVETDEQKTTEESKNDIVGNTIFLYKNQIVIRNKSEDGEINRQGFIYKDFITSFTGNKDIIKFNKANLIEYLKSDKMNSYYIRFLISTMVEVLLVNVVITLLDGVELALLGWITCIVARIKLRFSSIYNISLHALTLSIILKTIYTLINYFVSFEITYFQIAYITIAYIYLAAVIFIVKDDFIKKLQEVEKIKKEQEKVREEISKQEKKEEEKKENKKNKDEKEGNEKKEKAPDIEPDGSQA